MRKDAYYFHHDSNARHDPKVIAMLSTYGTKGYGCYWVLIEILREQEGYRYPTKGKYSWNSIAKELQISVEDAKSFVKDCVEEFELLSMDDDCFWSESLFKRMEKLDNRREQARDAANARWNKKPTPKPTATKPKGLKNPIGVLNKDEEWSEFKQELLSNDEFAELGETRIDLERLRAVDWMKSRGKVYKDYKSMFKNWLRKSEEMNSSKPTKRGMVF